MQPLTVDEVVKKINEKLDEAEDFLEEMEKTQEDHRLFRHRLSAFLSAANSVIEIIEAQGTLYAHQRGKSATFESWLVGEEVQFRTPYRGKSKNPKPKGTNAVWVYLRQARHDTIHLEQVNPSDKIAGKILHGLFKLQDRSEADPPSIPVSVQKNKKIWRFTEVEVFDVN